MSKTKKTRTYRESIMAFEDAVKQGRALMTVAREDMVCGNSDAVPDSIIKLRAVIKDMTALFWEISELEEGPHDFGLEPVEKQDGDE